MCVRFFFRLGCGLEGCEDTEYALSKKFFITLLH